MRIGIDARLYGVGDRGIGRYTQKLIEYLEKKDIENEYFIFLKEDGYNNYQPQNKNFHKVLANYRPYSFGEQLIFPFKLYKFHLDLIHFTHFNAPLLYRKSFVVTIHDLIISRFPDSRKKATTLPPILYQIKLFFYQLIIRLAAHSAKRIITVSEFTKKEITEILKIKPEKIIVAYEGVDKLPVISDNLSVLNSKFQILNPYLLYVGAAYPHKNLERLIIAFERFIKLTKNKTIKLLLIGKNDFFYQQIEQLIKSLDLSAQVDLIGKVNDEQLVSFYQNALCFILPSLAEGFGLTGLEAMACGTPVVSSNVFSLPEIFGEAAYYFNPYKIDEITDAIKKITSNKKLREDLINRGFEQIKKYSWQKMALMTLNTYKYL